MFRKTAQIPCWKSPVPWAHSKSSPVLTALCTQKLHRCPSIKTTQGSFFFFPLLTSLSANFQPGKPLALVLLWDQQWHWKSKGDALTVAAFTSPASCKQWEKHKTEPVKQPRNTDFSYWPSADGGSGRDACLLSLRSQHILSPQDLLAEWGDKADRKLK